MISTKWVSPNRYRIEKASNPPRGLLAFSFRPAKPPGPADDNFSARCFESDAVAATAEVMAGAAGDFDLGALATARSDGLEGPPGMDFAIGQQRHLVAPAEMEVRQLRIANRPAATAIGQRLDRLALGQRDFDLLRRRHVSFCIHIEGPHGRIAALREPRLDRSFGIGHARARPMRFHSGGGGPAR